MELIEAVAAARGLGVRKGKRRLRSAQPLDPVKPGPVTVSANVWAALDQLAGFTYVPATAQLRALGAV